MNILLCLCTVREAFTIAITERMDDAYLKEEWRLFKYISQESISLRNTFLFNLVVSNSVKSWSVSSSGRESLCKSLDGTGASKLKALFIIDGGSGCVGLDGGFGDGMSSSSLGSIQYSSFSYIKDSFFNRWLLS